MLAVREYTSKDVNPIVAPAQRGAGCVFRPEVRAQLSATDGFRVPQGQSPQYQGSIPTARPPSIPPTSSDKADTFEAGGHRSSSAPNPRSTATGGERASPPGQHPLTWPGRSRSAKRVAWFVIPLRIGLRAASCSPMATAMVLVGSSTRRLAPRSCRFLRPPVLAGPKRQSSLCHGTHFW